MNFATIHAELDRALLEAVDYTYATLPPDAWPVGGVEPRPRPLPSTRWADATATARGPACSPSLTLRGTPILYYGDELSPARAGRTLPREALRDPAGDLLAGARGTRRVTHADAGAPGRGTASPRGTSSRGCSATATAVRSTSSGPTSDHPLHLARDLIALRRREADLRTECSNGSTRPTAPKVLAAATGTGGAKRRGQGPLEVPLRGRIVLSTTREREGRRSGHQRLDWIDQWGDPN